MHVFSQTWYSPDSDQKDRQLALEHLADAWHGAEGEGIEPEAIAHAAIFAALATLVSDYGEEAVADLISSLPERIRAGEYSVDRTVQ
ncbi:MAG: hypothetical protein KKH72_00915 [Alphaproteobacteria bacterium]|nr:hypothetical protein [Alphaproteobacteria bacterium]